MCPEDGSAARLSEISQNVRNFIQIADELLENFGHEILGKNARNFTLVRYSPKMSEIWSKMAEKWANLTFFLTKNFQFFFTFFRFKIWTVYWIVFYFYQWALSIATLKT